MKTQKKIFLFLVAGTFALNAGAQDPSFSQFFASPLNINPALTGDINGKWRVISNYRSQWIGMGEPYATGTISIDNKIFQNVVGNYVDENTRFAIGGMMMYDQTLDGALKGNYASFNVSGNIRLMKKEGYEMNGSRIRHMSKIKMDDGAEQRLGVALGVSYGKRRLDLTKLTFENQFTGNGFDTNLPTGESAFANMKSYFSVNAGLIYSIFNENMNFELGVSGFHLNKPKQTFLNDDKQFLAPRYVIHGNLETFIGEQLILNTNGIYQYQSGASYFSVGGALGFYLPNDEKDVIINAGLWYWSKNSVIPYIGFMYGNYQVGLTYDITVSSLANPTNKLHTFEICMIFRGKGNSSGVIPSPWK
jgi:type IX secretion system PorP/SprF family membrane protein